MSPESVTLFGLLDAALKAFGLVREGKIRRDEKTDKALTDLLEAVSKTELYINEFNNRNIENRKTEKNLAQLWRKASISLRMVDADLADRCYLKGTYWINPEEWPEGKIKEARIEINQVSNEARHLLSR